MIVKLLIVTIALFIIIIAILIFICVEIKIENESDSEEFIPDDKEIYSTSLMYGLPICVVNTIYSTEKHTKKEYDLMLYGASILYNEQPLLGRRLPNTDDPRVIEINKALVKNNITIQYHPKYGMTYCEYIPNPDWESISNSN